MGTPVKSKCCLSSSLLEEPGNTVDTALEKRMQRAYKKRLFLPTSPEEAQQLIEFVCGVSFFCHQTRCSYCVGGEKESPNLLISKATERKGKLNPLLLFFETEFRSCYPGWSAMARSRLTVTFASWVQAILLPQPPE